MPTTEARSFEYWQSTIAGSVRGLSDEQIDEAAREAHRAELAGERTCAWHAASVVCRTVCHCAPCVAARAKAGA